MFGVVELDVLHGFFTTTDPTPGQRLVAAAIGSTVLWVGELVEVVLRARAGSPAHGTLGPGAAAPGVHKL